MTEDREEKEKGTREGRREGEKGEGDGWKEGTYQLISLQVVLTKLTHDRFHLPCNLLQETVDGVDSTFPNLNTLSE